MGDTPGDAAQDRRHQAARDLAERLLGAFAWDPARWAEATRLERELEKKFRRVVKSVVRGPLSVVSSP